jgi:hypothetical protein
MADAADQLGLRRRTNFTTEDTEDTEKSCALPKLIGTASSHFPFRYDAEAL